MTTSNTDSLLIPDLAALLTDAPAQGILSRTFLRAPELRAVLFRFAAGEQLSEHTSSHPAVLHFLEGSAELTLGDVHHSVTAGAWAYLPPALPHSIQAITPVTLLLTLVG